MFPLTLTACTVVNALGHGLDATRAALRARRSGLKPCDFDSVSLPAWIGEVAGVDGVCLPAALADYDGRNNRLAQLALDQDGFAARVAAAVARYGRERVAIVLGTSTSGILETERAWRRRDPATGALPDDFHFATTQNLHATTEYVARVLGLGGPQATVSTACSSSAKVFADAARLIALGLADAVVVGGVDSLCRNTLYGFASLELLSPEPCRPCAADRRGISIGEAAGFALLERAQDARDHTGVQLLGVGESSDAHHMSTPDPSGAGAALAMRRALAHAGLSAGDIDYINLHATASAANDAMETAAVQAVFGDAVMMSGTKGWTGHALGAAGIVEAAVSVICLRDGLIPGCLNTATRDPALPGHIVLDNLDRPLRRVLSNSFGFGGSNASLVFGRVD